MMRISQKVVNNLLINNTKTLNLKQYNGSSLTDIKEIISNFHNHISIKKIKEPFSNLISGDFSF